MAKTAVIRVPLPISKSETPKNVLAKTAMTSIGIAIQRTAKTLTTPVAWTEFWGSLQAYCTRNLAEATGTAGGNPPAAGGKGPATARSATPAKPVRSHKAKTAAA